MTTDFDITQRDLDDLRRRSGVTESRLNETFTKKHFQQVAKLLSQIEDVNLRSQLSEMFVTLFQQSNPRFDIARWNKAVGI